MDHCWRNLHGQHLHALHATWWRPRQVKSKLEMPFPSVAVRRREAWRRISRTASGRSRRREIGALRCDYLSLCKVRHTSAGLLTKELSTKTHVRSSSLHTIGPYAAVTILGVVLSVSSTDEAGLEQCSRAQANLALAHSGIVRDSYCWRVDQVPTHSDSARE